MWSGGGSSEKPPAFQVGLVAATPTPHSAPSRQKVLLLGTGSLCE